MPDDQRIRQQLIRFADDVPVDTDGELHAVVSAGRTRLRRRRAAVVAGIPLAVVLVVGGGVVWAGSRAPEQRAPAAAPSRITGTWQRTMAAGEELPAEGSGTWTMVIGADGALTLVPPAAWTAAHGQPTGVYLRNGDALRTNVLASELCAGTAGTYSFTVDPHRLALTPSAEPCPDRGAVLGGRWDRAP